ncbi:hypothetical protein [Paucibacter sp. XJ19-41]|uniref:hypothetical protein n=1 Tax=Paucibacter sp. XJ19-41 TaxID=2927824 RepID=UPI0023498395|nr:hypothetical protein [Paucibacter sp. XJ19-41]MDC6168337.1 hypothetical protein [Paucibacter sp. XJ19-41]
MGKASRLKLQRQAARIQGGPSANDFWVVVHYADDGGEAETDFIGCSSYRQALTILQGVSPLASHLGTVDALPERCIEGVLLVELYDFEGRVLWSSDHWAGVGHVMPVKDWASGRFAFRGGDIDASLGAYVKTATLALPGASGGLHDA